MTQLIEVRDYVHVTREVDNNNSIDTLKTNN